MSNSIDSPAQPPLNMMTTVTADNHHQIEEKQIDHNLITNIATNSSNNNNNSNNGDDDNNNSSSNKDSNDGIAAMSRKEKRKALKKMKRKQVRKEIAMKERQEEEARLNDPEEQLRLARLEQEEAQRMERERIEFEERERRFLQALELKKKQEEEEEERWKLLQESKKEAKNENGKEEDEDDDWEYVEEGPAEIIWKGNEIIVKKKKVRVPKKPLDTQKETQESERPISNPLAPQSEVFEDYRNAQDVLESVAQQVPNFGTEQDKEHCPFHLKTGACRFGARCSRVHFYPDKACTLLLKNMYHGPGLAWEQDEGLEYTEEEAERSFEDFYEDVHTEFLKFGEIVNFKVCRNGSPHLRGNVYVHYKSLESAVLAYQSINGRYFAGKQLTCEYVNLTRWRVAICGEYMKSRLKTCSRGSACNFIHCFRNPGGDYEWADWDKPAPRYWLKSMAALFGYSSNRFTDDNSPGYRSRSSRSRGLGSPHRKSLSNEDDNHKRRSLWRHRDDERESNYLDGEMQGRKNMHQDNHCMKHRENNNGDILSERTHDQRSFLGMKRSLEKRRESDSTKQDSKNGRSDAIYESTERGISDRYLERKIRSSSRQKIVEESVHDYSHKTGNKVDQGKNSYVDKHHHRFHRKKLSQEKNETNTSNIDSHCHSSDSEEDKHHSHSKNNFRRMKNETDVSSSASDESRHGRDDERKLKNRRESPRLDKKRSVAEIGGDEDTLECDDDWQQHRRGKKSSRLLENISETYEGGGRLGKEEKRPRKSSRLKDQLATEKESERNEVRHHRHSKKHSRRRKDYADSSDSASEEDRRDRYENRPPKSRRTSSRSRNESDFADIERSRERNDGEERNNGHKSTAKYNIKEPSLAKVGSNAYSRSRDGDKSLKKGETNVINFEIDVRCRNFDVNPDQNHPELEHPIDRYRGAGCPTSGSYIVNPDAQGKIIGKFDDTNDEGLGRLAYERDLKRLDKEHMLQMNKSDEKATVSDGKAEAELEKACRYAALKRLEEIKKHKNTQAAHSSESLEGLNICAHENVGANGVDVSRVPEEAGSSELETNVASVKRRRI